MATRDFRIDLVKLIAAGMVVILHTIECNSGGGITGKPLSAGHLWNTAVSRNKRLLAIRSGTDGSICSKKGDKISSLCPPLVPCNWVN